MSPVLILAFLQVAALQPQGARDPLEMADTATQRPPVEAIAAVRVDADGNGTPDRMGDTVRIAGRASVGSGEINRNYTFMFMQDASAGIALFTTDRLGPALAGDSVIATGVVHQYQGLSQLRLLDLEVVPAPRVPPEPVVLTPPFGDLEAHEGKLVQVRGALQAGAGSEIGRYGILADGGADDVGLFVSGAHNDPPELGRIHPSDEIVVTGALGQHDMSYPLDEGYQLFPRSPEDVVIHGMAHVRKLELMRWGAALLGLALLWFLLTRLQVRRRTRELRLTAHRFQALTENAHEMITVLDERGRVTYSSRGLERILGWTPAERDGQNVFELIHPDDLERVRTVFGEVLATPGATRVLEFRARASDGRFRTLSAVTQNRTDDPVVAGVVVNSRDVTERQALEAQLQQSKKLEAIGRVAGGIAHDFNNLMTVVSGHTEMLLEGPRDEAMLEEGLREIAAATERASSLTTQLLAFSRRQMLRPRVVDLAEVLGAMESLLRRLIGEDIEMTFQLDADTGCVLADSTQLEQVVMNLAVNARDAMPDGGRLTIRLSRVTLDDTATFTRAFDARPGDYVELTVTDTGVGIEPEALEHIFDPFYTTKRTGTGLGLATVYGVVKQSGGHIRVDSDAGGTTFRILLPRTAQQAAASSPCEPEACAARAGATILLVEDEPALRSMAERMLCRAGYHVLTAAHGAEALPVLESDERVDLLLTDVVMPELGGRELAECAAVLRPGLPVLFMSGYTDDHVLRRGVIADGRQFLAKPFSSQQLLGRVAVLLGDATRFETAGRS